MKLFQTLVLLAAGASASTVSPVQKVVQMLESLKTKVQADLKAESAAMEEYEQYCGDESKERGFAIETAAWGIEDNEAIIESTTAKVAEFEATIAEAGTTVATKQGELSDAKKVRADTKAEFDKAEKELVDTVDMLGRAASVLKRELSFVQGGKNKNVIKKMGNMITALSAIVNASWVSTASRTALSSFLQKASSPEDNDLSLLQAPQAVTKAYESKSGSIVETLLQMQDEAEGQLAALRKAEMKSKFDFQMLEQSLTDAIKNLEDQISEATSAKSTTESEKAKAEEELASTKESKAADEAFLKKLQLECQTKASEWETRQKDAADEQAAIEKAKEILTSGVKESFVQVSVKTHRINFAQQEEEQEVDADKRSSLVKILKSLGRKFNSFALLQAANKAKSDPFVKIRGLVNDMIAKLEKEAEKEATQEAFCQAETKKTKAGIAKNQESVDKFQTRLDKANAAVTTLTNEISDLNAELSEMWKSTKEMTKIRTEEKALYDKSSSDYKQSAEAVQGAITVLQEYYGGASFIQQPSFGGKKSDSAGGIVAMLEVALSDFTKLLAEAEADESQAVNAYEDQMQANEVSKAKKEAEVKGKTTEIAQLKVAIEDNTGDLSTASKELDAVMEYLEKLKPQCESKAMTYEERKAKRDSEIAGLKEALGILSGDAPALSLVQKKAFLARIHPQQA